MAEEMVNHPQHYENIEINGQKVEVIDLIKDILKSGDYSSVEGAEIFNILKYLLRYPYKGKAVEDLEKAGWYLQDLIRELKSSVKDNDKNPSLIDEVNKELSKYGTAPNSDDQSDESDKTYTVGVSGSYVPAGKENEYEDNGSEDGVKLEIKSIGKTDNEMPDLPPLFIGQGEYDKLVNYGASPDTIDEAVFNRYLDENPELEQYMDDTSKEQFISLIGQALDVLMEGR